MKAQGKIIIAGCTASGKSQLAEALADKLDGVIINADSMQVYADLPILTAQPEQARLQPERYKLYSNVDGSARYSAGKWLECASIVINSTVEAGKTPIIVGGSGLYIKALLGGLDEIAPVNLQYESEAVAKIAAIGINAFYNELITIDHQLEGRVDPANRQRLIRAYAVFKSTGKSLVSHHTANKLTDNYFTILLMPEREWVYKNCENRFKNMLQSGAKEEVSALLARGLDPFLPIMKAIGVREIAGGLLNNDWDGATEQAVKSTRHYIKRQFTWFRHQLHADMTIDPASTSIGTLEKIITEQEDYFTSLNQL